MEIKQKHYADIEITDGTHGSKVITSVYRTQPIIAQENIPAVCAALMGKPVKTVEAFMSGQSVWVVCDCSGLPNKPETPPPGKTRINYSMDRKWREILDELKGMRVPHQPDKPEPKKPVCRICGAAIEAIKNGFNKPK